MTESATVTKKYEITDLDCAHCAQRIEDAVNKLDGVECKITFALSIMKITTARDFKAVEKEVRRIMKIVKPESSIKEIR